MLSAQSFGHTSVLPLKIGDYNLAIGNAVKYVFYPCFYSRTIISRNTKQRKENEPKNTLAANAKQ